MAAAKMGRPTESPKDYMLRVRMDQETLRKLDECAEIMETNRSHAVRIAINRLEEYVKEIWGPKN